MSKRKTKQYYAEVELGKLIDLVERGTLRRNEKLVVSAKYLGGLGERLLQEQLGIGSLASDADTPLSINAEKKPVENQDKEEDGGESFFQEKELD